MKVSESDKWCGNVLFFTIMAEEKYGESNKKWPRKNLSAGFGNYCCIPGCKSAFFRFKSTKDRDNVVSAPVKRQREKEMD